MLLLDIEIGVTIRAKIDHNSILENHIKSMEDGVVVACKAVET